MTTIPASDSPNNPAQDLAEETVRLGPRLKERAERLLMAAHDAGIGVTIDLGVCVWIELPARAPMDALWRRLWEAEALLLRYGAATAARLDIPPEDLLRGRKIELFSVDPEPAGIVASFTVRRLSLEQRAHMHATRLDGGRRWVPSRLRANDLVRVLVALANRSAQRTRGGSDALDS